MSDEANLTSTNDPFGTNADHLCPRNLRAISAYTVRSCGVASTRNGQQTNTGAYKRPMRFLHAMVRISSIEDSLDFYCNKLGLREVRRTVNEPGRFTLIFLAAPDDLERDTVELTYNWDPEVYTGGRNFGHLAFDTTDIYALCTRLQSQGVAILRPPRDGRMAFIKSPDGVSVELLQRGAALPPQEPWLSMKNQGSW